MTIFRENYEKKRAQRLLALENKRQAILKILPDIACSLKKINVSLILVHGSILRPGRFHERSDLDMILFGAQTQKWYQLCKIVDDYLSPFDINPDVRLSQDLSTSFIDNVKKLGMPFIYL
ncbi:hypothetical protein MHK_001904 [Candidatus Magnetomorum sp. HK-1]|nr:hypothetical protein MHK_001904 [Candidatus Magnetomorum sp. HK-1]